ncbi:relA-associated inhibitor [Gastrophryne carolinensis]
MVQTQRPHKLLRYGSLASLTRGRSLPRRLWTKLLRWRDSLHKMAGDPVRSSQSLLDLNFQSLAAQELNAKQLELDSATAKLDELRRDLERRRMTASSETSESLSIPSVAPALSPSLSRRTYSAPVMPAISVTQSEWPRLQDSAPPRTSSSNTIPVLSLSPNVGRRSVSSDNMEQYMPPPGARARPPSPRLQYYERPIPSPTTTRLSSGSYDYSMANRPASPVPEGPPHMPMYADRAPPLRQNPAYDAPLSFTAPRFPADESVLRRRPPQRNWNESDLDLIYDKKPQDRADRASLGGVPIVKAWRESSLDPSPTKGKGDSSSTLPRGYKFSMERGSQGPDPGWRPGSGTLPRNLPPQQPISRIPVPPPGGRGQPHRPLPLSMIFRLQNAFWEHQAPPQMYATHAPAHVPAAPPVSIPVIPEMPIPVVPAATPAEEVPRPLSPTRLQPQLPPSLAEVQRVLEDIPRPLRRRGSQEHTPQAPPLPTDRRQYRQIMGRLFGRAAHKTSQAQEQQKAEDKLQGTASKGSPAHEELTAEDPTSKMVPIPEEPRQEDIFFPKATPTEDPVCIIMDSNSRVGASAVAQEAELGVPVVIGGSQSLELRSALKTRNSPSKSRPRHARLDPLILLLDGALTGELDVVTQALKEVNDPSQPNEEGITALHNAICGANYHIVNLLITSGANVNAADSHGWTPLHCAASCNDLQVCSMLVRHGAAIFATTYSDGSLAVDKCDPYRQGYKECLTYLTEVEQCMGETQSGVIYAVWDYSAEFADELSVREGDPVTVLRKDGDGGVWWWASLCGREGYIPRNYFGMYPRIRPQRSPL